MSNINFNKNKKGFTLIELLVTIAILAIIAGVGVDMFATVMRAYRKAEVFSLLERNGSQVLTQIEQDIRSSIDVEITNAGVVSSSGDAITVSIPQGAAIVEKTYNFIACTDSSNPGDITITSGSDTGSLINKQDENIVNEQVYIKRVDGEEFVKQAFNNVYISFVVGSQDCNTPEVGVFQQVSVNLRGGLE